MTPANFTDYILDENDGYYLPANLKGKPICKDIEPNRIRSRETLKRKYDNGIKRFIMRPAAAGLVAIDADVREQGSGLDELIEILGYDPREKHFTVKSPGGYHFYFLNTELTDYLSNEIKPFLEVKFRAFITVPGSISTKGKYEILDETKEILDIPDALKKIMKIRKPVSTLYAWKNERNNTSKKNLTIDKIYSILLKQGIDPNTGRRNRFVFELARFARKEGCTEKEINDYCCFLINSDFLKSEIEATVKSAFRGF